VQRAVQILKKGKTKKKKGKTKKYCTGTTQSGTTSITTATKHLKM
jgi:hypothetical protein